MASMSSSCSSMSRCNGIGITAWRGRGIGAGSPGALFSGVDAASSKDSSSPSIERSIGICSRTKS